MIHFDQDELESLVETLSEQPGFITAAVIPAGSGTALIARLREELGELEVEVAGGGEKPVDLGERAIEFGRSRDGKVFVLQLDEPDFFDSEGEAVQFWRELNFQREAFGAGTVRTCFLLSEQTELGLARIADDLWDWATVFRFPKAVQASVRTPADAEALVWGDENHHFLASESDLMTLRSQWQRAYHAELPAATFLENYAVPLFLVLPKSCDAEAIKLWQRDLHSADEVARLPPEVALLVARKMMALGSPETLESARGDLIQGALITADGAVERLRTKATAHPETFGPGFAAAVSSSAKLHQDAGNFEVALGQLETCIDFLRSSQEGNDGAEELIEAHQKRRWALLFLLRAREIQDLPLLEQVEALQAMQDPSLSEKLRSNALGAALEISLIQPDNLVPQANSCLFTAWLLSDDFRLKGPACADVLAQDPVTYCKSMEALWQLKVRTPWEKVLVEPLSLEWAEGGPVSAVIHQQLASWLLHFENEETTNSAGDKESKKRLRAWTGLQWIAVRVLGHRYEPTLLRLFCRYLSSFSKPGRVLLPWRHRAELHVGFMLRWSYQERVLRPLLEVASDSESSQAEIEAAKDLAYTLWQEEVPEGLRRQSRSDPEVLKASFCDQLRRGEQGLFSGFSPGEFIASVPNSGIAPLAGDPSVPDLSREDELALGDGLRALIRTGMVRDDDGQVSQEDWIFDAWIPWRARCHAKDWWMITAELIERQFDLPASPWALMRFPVLGIWHREEPIAAKIEEKIILATGGDGEKLRDNHGLLELLRWALHVEDSNILLRCFEALVKEKEFTEFAKFQPIPQVMTWALDRPTFEVAGEWRRRASGDIEQRLWFLVEWPFVDRLSPKEALVWCKEVVPLAARWEDLRWILIDQLVDIDDRGALELLLGEEGVANPQSQETQSKILYHAAWRQDLDHLTDCYPKFVEGLPPTLRGLFFLEAGQTEELRQWGHTLFSSSLSKLPDEAPIDDADLVFNWRRRALHQWARLEPKAFLVVAEEVVAQADARGFVDSKGYALLEATLLVWQELEPLAAADARARLPKPMIHHAWKQGHSPVHVDILWDSEFSSLSSHRTLRFKWLRECSSDKAIAEHSLAARSNELLPEVESIGEELLSLDLQLERALGVSLLAWHPDGDRWLEPLLRNDPSAWVRHHARWAIDVCRRDRLGRLMYRRALSSPTWLEQQARFEQLVPLVLPTFSLWSAWDEELSELAEALPPRRKALLVDFKYYINKKVQWKNIVGRDLEKFCRGEDISIHLEPGEKGPPWQRGAAAIESAIP